jgi:ABC-2 type transport system ATP-binding protein
LGFVEPSSGEAGINGVSVANYALETKTYLSYIPEMVKLYPNITVIENLQFFSKLAGFDYSTEVLGDF